MPSAERLRIVLLAILGTVVLAARPAAPADVDHLTFRVEWDEPSGSGADALISGSVVNDSPVRVGDVPAGGRAYFVVRVTTLGAAYRISVESYDAIAVTAGDRDGGPAAPSSR